MKKARVRARVPQSLRYWLIGSQHNSTHSPGSRSQDLPAASTGQGHMGAPGSILATLTTSWGLHLYTGEAAPFTAKHTYSTSYHKPTEHTAQPEDLGPATGLSLRCSTSEQVPSGHSSGARTNTKVVSGSPDGAMEQPPPGIPGTTSQQSGNMGTYQNTITTNKKRQLPIICISSFHSGQGLAPCTGHISH